VHHLEKRLVEQVVYTFLGKKEHRYFTAIRSGFVFSSIVTTNIQKILQPTNTGAERIYYKQILNDSQPYFPQCIQSRLSPAGLRVHPGKQQIDIGSEILALPEYDRHKARSQ